MDSSCACARRAAASSSSGAGRRAAGASRRRFSEPRGLGESSLRPRERVRSAGDFRRAFRKGLRLDGPLFTLLAVANQLEVARIGLAAGRRVGGAAVRNRAKRLLRETFRRNKTDLVRGLDLILVPKKEIGDRTLSEVEAEYRSRLARLARRLAPRQHGSNPDRTD